MDITTETITAAMGKGQGVSVGLWVKIHFNCLPCCWCVRSSVAGRSNSDVTMRVAWLSYNCVVALSNSQAIQFHVTPMPPP